MLKCLQGDVSAETTLGNTYLKPVSFVSNDAAAYPDTVEEVLIHAQLS